LGDLPDLLVEDPTPYKLALFSLALIVPTCLSVARTANRHPNDLHDWIVDVAHMVTVIIFAVMLLDLFRRGISQVYPFTMPWLAKLVIHENVAFYYGLVHSILLVLRELKRGLGKNHGRDPHLSSEPAPLSV